ncbi:ABC transporter permease subunit [Candidatus Saccharibacteria bacterium]|jgi:ABC-type transport system involved in multi-copper enzyme maturation permease subunit|nr:ABC transporter permease subunit [Candidatus Saccharibacteria bacterium]
MFKNILSKTLYEKRWMMVAWSLGMIITAAITMALYPSFSQLGADEFVNSVPDSLKSLIGSVESFKSIPGYVAQQIYGPQIPIMTIVLAIVLYVGIGVGEEDRGVLQTLMAQPITRTQLYLQKLYAGGIILTAVSVAVAVGVLGGVVALGEDISLVRLFQATLMLSLLNIAYGVVAYAIGLGTGKKALAIGIASTYAFLSSL